MQSLILAAILATGPTGDTFGPTDTKINNATLSASPSMTLRIGNFNALTVYVAHTYAGASAITMSCNAGQTAAIAAPVAVATVGSSGITMADAAWNYPTTGISRTYRMMVAPLNDKVVTCTFGGTGATADAITVYAYAGDN